MQKNLKVTFMCLLLSLGMHAQVVENKSDRNESPNWVSTLNEHLEFNGYAQAGYTYSNPCDGKKSYFDLKRVLMWCKANVTDRWSLLFMHDFKSVVQEFYTDYRISSGKEMTIRFGQFKHSYSMENPLSPTKTELIEIYSQGVTYLTGCGSDPLYGVQYGRDLGLEVYGDLFKGKVHYEVAVMNGAPINKRDNNTDKDFIAKIEYKPTPNFKVSTSGYLGTGHALDESPYCPDIKVGDDYKRNRYAVGADWKSIPGGGDNWLNRATAIHGEIIGGEDGDTGSFGAYVTGTLPVSKTVDIVASVDYFNFNTDLGYKQTNLVFGVQHWVYKKCRLQLQYTHCMPSKDMPVTDGAYGMLQGQVQFAF